MGFYWMLTLKVCQNALGGLCKKKKVSFMDEIMVLLK